MKFLQIFVSTLLNFRFKSVSVYNSCFFCIEVEKKKDLFPVIFDFSSIFNSLFSENILFSKIFYFHANYFPIFPDFPTEEKKISNVILALKIYKAIQFLVVLENSSKIAFYLLMIIQKTFLITENLW